MRHRRLPPSLDYFEFSSLLPFASSFFALIIFVVVVVVYSSSSSWSSHAARAEYFFPITHHCQPAKNHRRDVKNYIFDVDVILVGYVCGEWVCVWWREWCVCLFAPSASVLRCRPSLLGPLSRHLTFRLIHHSQALPSISEGTVRAHTFPFFRSVHQSLIAWREGPRSIVYAHAKVSTWMDSIIGKSFASLTSRSSVSVLPDKCVYIWCTSKLHIQRGTDHHNWWNLFSRQYISQTEEELKIEIFPSNWLRSSKSFF